MALKDFVGFEANLSRYPRITYSGGAGGLGTPTSYEAAFDSAVAGVPSGGLILYTFFSGPAVLVGSIRILFFGALPAVDVNDLLEMRCSDLDARYQIGFDATSGGLRARIVDESGAAGSWSALSDPLVPDQVYRVGFAFDADAWALDWEIDGEAQASVAGSGGSLTASQFRMNLAGGAGTTLQVDDLVFFDDAADYPLPPMTTKQLIPSADGTHNNPSSFLKNGLSQTIDGSHPAYSQLVEDGGGTEIMQTGTAATEYVEVLFGDLPLASPPLGVRATAGMINSANASANNWKVKLLIPGQSDYTLFDGTTFLFPSGSNPIVYGEAVFGLDDYDLTVDLVNGFKARVGFSSDASPTPEMDFVRLEVLLDLTPPTRARASFSGTAKATPAHFIASPKGHAQSLKLGQWSATERANGGWIGQTGQIPKSLVDEDPSLFAPRSNLYTVVRETGEIIASCKLNEPGVNGGLADLAGQGPFEAASREFRRLFLQDPKIETWEEQGSEPHGRGKPPKSGPDLALGVAGNPNVGIHKYKVTFVSADGETRGGPTEAIDVTSSAKKVELTNIPKGPKWVTARKIYRTTAGGSTFKLLTTLADNTTTAYTDNTADGSLGADIPSGFAATEIEVSKPDGDGSILFKVTRGATVEDQQLARIINDKDREKISRVAIRTDPVGSQASAYTLILQAAQDKEHAFSAVDSWTCDDLPGEIDVNVGTDASLVAFALRREGAVTNAQPFSLTLTEPRVNGIATGDFFDCADVMRLGAAALGISDRYVRDSGVNALPGDYRGMTWEEIFDLMTILTGFRWLIYRIGRRAVLDFRKWGAGGRKWGVFDPEAVRNLDPQPRFNYQTVQDPKGRVLASATADPNPLDRRVEAPPIVLEHRVAQEKALRLAQVSADFHAQRRYAGTIVATRLMKNGRWHPAQDARAGDLVYEPYRKVTLRVDELEREHSFVTLTTLPRFQQLERFNAKLQKHLELVGKL